MVNLKISIQKYSFPSDGDCSSILNDEFGRWVAMFIAKGSILLKVGDREMDCGIGVVIRPPELPAKTVITSSGGFFAFVIRLPAPMVWRVAQANDMNLFPASKTCHYLGMNSGRADRLSNYFKLIMDTMESGQDPSAEEVVRNLSVALICHYFEYGMNYITNYKKGGSFKDNAAQILMDAGITSKQIEDLRAAMIENY